MNAAEAKARIAAIRAHIREQHSIICTTSTNARPDFVQRTVQHNISTAIKLLDQSCELLQSHLHASQTIAACHDKIETAVRELRLCEQNDKINELAKIVAQVAKLEQT